MATAPVVELVLQVAPDNTVEPSRSDPKSSRLPPSVRIHPISHAALSMSAVIATGAIPFLGARKASQKTNPRIPPSRGPGGSELIHMNNKMEPLEQPSTFTIPGAASASRGNTPTMQETLLMGEKIVTKTSVKTPITLEELFHLPARGRNSGIPVAERIEITSTTQSEKPSNRSAKQTKPASRSSSELSGGDFSRGSNDDTNRIQKICDIRYAAAQQVQAPLISSDLDEPQEQLKNIQRDVLRSQDQNYDLFRHVEFLMANPRN